MIPVQEKNKKTQEAPYSLQNLGFYFDSLSQDRIDRGMLSRKAGQILNLREKLMQLPEPEFETTVKTIAKFVETILPAAVESQKSKAPVSSQVRREALQVFERAAEESIVTHKKSVPAAESVARVS
ncbi:MAG: hypothetical protein RIQ81_546 [Pseudomonadota bacterium]